MPDLPHTLHLLREQISRLPLIIQLEVADYAATLREIARQQPALIFAMTLVATEMAVEAESEMEHAE